jgi:hypothetical protein
MKARIMLAKRAFGGNRKCPANRHMPMCIAIFLAPFNYENFNSKHELFTPPISRSNPKAEFRSWPYFMRQIERGG